MKKLLLLAIGVLAAAFPLQAQVLIFDDEFSGTTLSSKWFALDLYSDLNREEQCYQPSQVTVDSGYLKETAVARAVTCNGHTLPYTSGAVVWAPPLTFLYGTVEFKAKFAGCTGCWPAVWLLGYLCQPAAATIYNAHTCDWANPGADEIDILEILHSNFTSVNQQIHTDGHNNGCSPSTTDVSQNYHTYDLQWSDGLLKWYIDGELTCTISQSYVPNHQMYLIMNLALGGTGGRIDNATLPSSSFVEYVRVYQPPCTRIPCPYPATPPNAHGNCVERTCRNAKAIGPT